jgi:hypothetical protein
MELLMATGRKGAIRVERDRNNQCRIEKEPTTFRDGFLHALISTITVNLRDIGAPRKKLPKNFDLGNVERPESTYMT